jgi:hypothetical protein
MLETMKDKENALLVFGTSLLQKDTFMEIA